MEIDKNKTGVGDVVRAASAAARIDPNAKTTTSVVAPKGSPKPYAFKAMGVDDHGVIIGIGAVAGNVDLDNETLAQKGLVTMAYDFCGASQRTLKANHGDTMEKAELVASWPGAPVLKSGAILAPDAMPTDDDPVVAINIEKGKETHWFVGIRPNDDAVLETAKKGGIAGFSWGAFVTRTAAE
jgi:hypothetical protein